MDEGHCPGNLAAHHQCRDADGGADQAAHGRAQQQKDDDLSSAVERRGESYEATHQERSHKGLHGGSDADNGRDGDGCEQHRCIGRIEGRPDIDQERSKPDAWPYPNTVDQNPGQCEA